MRTHSWYLLLFDWPVSFCFFVVFFLPHILKIHMRRHKVCESNRVPDDSQWEWTWRQNWTASDCRDESSRPILSPSLLPHLRLQCPSGARALLFSFSFFFQSSSITIFFLQNSLFPFILHFFHPDVVLLSERAEGSQRVVPGSPYFIWLWRRWPWKASCFQ